MNRNEACIALVLLSVGALGCTEDVGDCVDPREGRDTVVVNNMVQYGGQAIINESCAGCHGTQVKGQARRGAPVGLDFDLFPVESEELVGSGTPMLKVDEPVLTGLRGRQRRVFEQRNLIWAQVKSGDMPPDGVGAAYRALSRIFDSREADICRRAKRSYDGVFQKSSMDILRNWLACNAPIVEANGAPLDGKMEGVAGKAGYQYPACPDPSADGGGIIPFETVYEEVLSGCVGCHNGKQPPDLTSMDTAFGALVEKQSSAGSCSGKTYVVPRDPTASLLLERLLPNASCGTGIMPPGNPLSASQVQLVRKWITDGALREADVPAGEDAQSTP